MSETREFHIGQILTVTTGIVFINSDFHAGDIMRPIYDILNFLTGDNLCAHQLPRASEWAAPLVKKELSWTDIDEATVKNTDYGVLRLLMGEKHGQFHRLPSFKAGWVSVDPIKELCAMVGEDSELVRFQP